MNEQADWSSLQLFLVLAEAGSLGRAVGLLGQSQATLSRQLASLEERLGQVLFERHARGLRLTAAGQHLLPSARRMREAAQDFAMSLAAREQSLAGTVAPDRQRGLLRPFPAAGAARAARAASGNPGRAGGQQRN